MLRNTLGTGQTYIKLSVEDPEKIEKVRHQYAELLKELNSNLDASQLQVFAFAKNANEPVTYLLPQFFSLSEEQQAKILIHESHVRGADAEKFKRAIELDGMIEDLSKDSKLILSAQFRIDRFYEILEELYPYFTEPVSTFGNWIAWLRVNKGILFSAEHFCRDMNFYVCSPDLALITANYEITAGFLRFLRQGGLVLYSGVSSSPQVAPTAYQDILQICGENLKTSNDYYFIYPLQTSNAHWNVSMVHCSRISDQISFELNVINL